MRISEHSILIYTAGSTRIKIHSELDVVRTHFDWDNTYMYTPSHACGFCALCECLGVMWVYERLGHKNAMNRSEVIQRWSFELHKQRPMKNGSTNCTPSNAQAPSCRKKHIQCTTGRQPNDTAANKHTHTHVKSSCDFVTTWLCIRFRSSVWNWLRLFKNNNSSSKQTGKNPFTLYVGKTVADTAIDWNELSTRKSIKKCWVKLCFWGFYG